MVTASELRQNIYRLLDRVLETGEPLEIERRGRRLRIVPAESGSKLERIKPRHDAIVGDPDDLARLDWSGSWTGALFESSVGAGADEDRPSSAG